MNPIIGPIDSLTNLQTYYDDKSKYVQAKPYDTRLPYRRRLCVRVSHAGSDPVNGWARASINYLSAESVCANYRTQVLNRAYDRFKSSLGENASMGVTIAQFGQARDMIVARATQMTTFVRALRRADIRGAARALSAPLPLHTRQRMERNARSKSLSSQILEWNFGWAPTISDIYASCEILSSEPVFRTVRGKYKMPILFSHGPDGLYSTGYRVSAEVYGQVIADVSVENPNLRLLNQLGLVNPLTFAYELVPWSFLWGWVSNVEQYLSSYTDLLGLRLSQPMTTSGFFGTYQKVWSGYPWQATFGVSKCVREAGLYKPTFHFKPLRFSPQRAANAISLLILQLPKR